MEESELSPAIKRFCGSFPVLLEKEVTVAEAEKMMAEQDALSKTSKGTAFCDELIGGFFVKFNFAGF